MIKPEPLSLGHARPSYTTPGDTIVGGNVLNLTLKRDFAVVRHVKPPASRADSAEIYVLATGFRKETRQT